MPMMDSTVPTLLRASSGYIGTTDRALLLEFSEPIMLGPKCKGSNPPSIILRGTADITISCAYPVLQRNKAYIIPPVPLVDGTTYFFEIETGFFVDAAGNENILTLTNGMFEPSIASAQESFGPEVVITMPADGDNDYNASMGITLFFTEEVSPAPGAGGNFSLGIVKCGAVCLETDPVLYTPALTLMTSDKGGAVLSITEDEGSFALENMARYKVTLPADSLKDGAG